MSSSGALEKAPASGTARPEGEAVVQRVVGDFMRGLAAFPRGVRWLRAHPRHVGLLAIPAALGTLFALLAFGAFVSRGGMLLDHVMFAQPEGGAALVGYYVVRALLYVAGALLVLTAAYLLASALAAPIYDAVSTAVERDVLGREPPSLGLRGQLRVVFVELRKAVLLLGLSTILLFIPGVNVVSPVIAAFLLGWNFFDYPLARRGWSLTRRMRLVGGEFWAVLGFGLWLVIPFAQLLVMPLAVVGGTLLNLDALQRRQLVNSYEGSSDAQRSRQP
jgi:CysZ protein